MPRHDGRKAKPPTGVNPRGPKRAKVYGLIPETRGLERNAGSERGREANTAGGRQSEGCGHTQPRVRAGAPANRSGERARRRKAGSAGEGAAEPGSPRRGAPGSRDRRSVPRGRNDAAVPARPESRPCRGPGKQRGPRGGEKPLKQPGLRPPGTPAPPCLRRRATAARSRGERRGRRAAPRRDPVPTPTAAPASSCPPCPPRGPRSPHRAQRRSSSPVPRPRWQPVRAQPEAATLQSRAGSPHAPSRSAAAGAR